MHRLRLILHRNSRCFSARIIWPPAKTALTPMVTSHPLHQLTRLRCQAATAARYLRTVFLPKRWLSQKFRILLMMTSSAGPVCHQFCRGPGPEVAGGVTGRKGTRHCAPGLVFDANQRKYGDRGAFIAGD